MGDFVDQAWEKEKVNGLLVTKVGMLVGDIFLRFELKKGSMIFSSILCGERSNICHLFVWGIILTVSVSEQFD